MSPHLSADTRTASGACTQTSFPQPVSANARTLSTKPRWSTKPTAPCADHSPAPGTWCGLLNACVDAVCADQHCTQLERGDAAVGEATTMDDPAFLAEAMEARQAVEEAVDTATLRCMLDDNAAAQRGMEEELQAAFAAGDMHVAQRLVAKLTYLVRLGEAIVDKL